MHWQAVSLYRQPPRMKSSFQTSSPTHRQNTSWTGCLNSITQSMATWSTKWRRARSCATGTYCRRQWKSSVGWRTSVEYSHRRTLSCMTSFSRGRSWSIRSCIASSTRVKYWRTGGRKTCKAISKCWWVRILVLLRQQTAWYLRPNKVWRALTDPQVMNVYTQALALVRSAQPSQTKSYRCSLHQVWPKSEKTRLLECGSEVNHRCKRESASLNINSSS